jgi:hypothetical protein
MTGTVLAARVSEYLGVGDVVTEAPYSSRILGALNRAADIVGAETALPLGVGTATCNATFSFSVDPLIRPDMILSAEGSGVYGVSPLAIIQPSEMRGLGLADSDSASNPKRPVALIVDPLAGTLTLFPRSWATFVTNLVYTGVRKSVNMATLADEPWTGAAHSAHHLIAIRAAVGLLQQDGREQEAQNLWGMYERERILSIQRLHGPRMSNELIQRLLTARDYAGGAK